MTPESMYQLLTTYSVIDPRLEVNDLALEAWFDLIGDVPDRDAATAFREHYRATDQRIMPADIRRLADRYRAERIRRIPPHEVVMADCLELRGVHFARVLQARLKALADGMATDVEDAALMVPPPPRLQLAEATAVQVIEP